jgi:nitric oxide dioxygenase
MPGRAGGQLADILAGEEGASTRPRPPRRAAGAARLHRAGKERGKRGDHSFLLAPGRRQPVLDFAPGQYIGVVATVDGVPMRRQYSLSAASNGRTYRISVKREEGGKVSNYLHDGVQAGGTVQLTPPSGDFVLTESDKPLVLISGGVGITPTLAMLAAALRGNRVRAFHPRGAPPRRACLSPADRRAGRATCSCSATTATRSTTAGRARRTPSAC